MRCSIIILIALSLACSKKEDSAPAQPEQAAETEAPLAAEGSEPAADPTELTAEELPPELQGETPPLGAPPTVKVLDQGEEPRQALRLKVKPGLEQKVSIDVGFTIDAVIMFLRVGSPNYVVQYGLKSRAEKVEPDATASVAFAIDNATMLSALSEKQGKLLNPELPKMRTVTGRYSLDPRGTITNIEFDDIAGANRVTADMADNLRWSILQVGPVFPEEPVGEGAKWTVHRGIQQGGIHVNQLSTMEVVKLEGTRVELKLAIDQSAAPQTFRNPGTETPLELVALRGVGAGDVAWELTEVMPRATNIQAATRKGMIQRDPKNPNKKGDVVVLADRTASISEK